MTTASPVRILLVEDNPGDVVLIEETLAQRHGAFALESVERLSAALARLSIGGIQVVLLDLTLPDSDGLATFTTMHTQVPDVPKALPYGTAVVLLGAVMAVNALAIFVRFRLRSRRKW